MPADKSVEWLKYEFINQTTESATVVLEWEKLVIPFKVETDVIKNQLAIFRNELRSEKGFTWEAWDQAATYCAQNKTNLDEALLWTDTATSVNFGGSQSFQAWSTRARVLDSLGRNAEAAATMKKALPYGTINDIYFYAGTLTKNKKGKEALEAFQANYNKYPKEFLAVAGMARGYSAVGDYKKALVYAKQAHDMAPGTVNKGITEKFIADLQAGKDINQ